MGLDRNLEAIVNVAIVLTLLWPVRGRIRGILSAIPRRYALFSVGILVALVGAQRAGMGEGLYPLTDWSMYSNAAPADPHFVDYVAELRSGRKERIVTRQLFPVGGRHLRMRIEESAEAIESSVGELARQAAVDKLDTMLAAIARKHDSLHPGDRIRTIRIYALTVSSRDPDGKTTTSRRLIHEYQVE